MEGSWPDLTPPVLQGQGATNRTPGTEVTSAQGQGGRGGLGAEALPSHLQATQEFNSKAGVKRPSQGSQASFKGEGHLNGSHRGWCLGAADGAGVGI